MNPNNIIMFHVGRCGSRVLGDLLDQHPQIEWPGEVLKPQLIKKHSPNHPDSFNISRYFDTLRQNQEAEILGIEVKFYHLKRIACDLPRFISLAEKFGYRRFIVLRRENLLRKIVSSLVAQKRGGLYHYTSHEKPPLTRFALDPAEVTLEEESKPLLSYLDSYSKDYDTVELTLDEKKVLSLNYENDIFCDPVNAYQKTCAFLSIEPCQVEVRYTKTTPFKLEEILLNFDEVAEALKATPHAWMTKEAD